MSDKWTVITTGSEAPSLVGSSSHRLPPGLFLSLIRVTDELPLSDHACLQQFRCICAKPWRSFSFNTLSGLDAVCEILGHLNRRIRKSASWLLDATVLRPCLTAVLHVLLRLRVHASRTHSDFLSLLASKKVILNLSPVSERCFRHSGRK